MIFKRNKQLCLRKIFKEIFKYSFIFILKDLLDEEDDNHIIFHSYPGSTSSLVNDSL